MRKNVKKITHDTKFMKLGINKTYLIVRIITDEYFILIVQISSNLANEAREIADQCGTWYVIITNYFL